MSADVELAEGMREVGKRLLHLNAEKTRIDAEIIELKAKLRSTLTVGQRGTIDGRPAFSVTSAPRRFNEAIALTVLTPELVALCSVTVLDAAKAKALLPPAVYTACTKAGEPVVRTL